VPRYIQLHLRQEYWPFSRMFPNAPRFYQFLCDRQRAGCNCKPWTGLNGGGERFALQTDTCHPKLKMCPNIFSVIQQPLQYCDKSPTEEAEPCDHHRYDQYGKEIDREPSARLQRQQSGLGRRGLQLCRSSEIIHNLCYRCFLASDE
jgi:hypothetical protein